MSLPALLAGATLLRQGVSGEYVRALQLVLRELGYPLSGTGYFGASTDTAVEDFQRHAGLVVDGVVGLATATALEAALRASPAVGADKPPLWLAVSLAHVGLKEGSGAKDNSDLVEAIQTVASDYQSDATPWCAGWVSFCLAKAGVKPSRSPLWALSYAEGWGVRLAGPAVGAIAIKTRNGGGHVTFVAGRTGSRALACCGGNQNDMVNVAPYQAAAFDKGFFWPSDCRQPAMIGFAHLPVVDAKGAASRES